jgi:hypothetical protein
MKPSFLGLIKDAPAQIGTYFTWKCMDLREAVFGYEVDWSGSERHMVELPKKGLDVIFGFGEDERPDYAKALLTVADGIKHLKAPPRYSRQCGVAEAETVCCMAKAYYKNKKPIGKDIVEKRHDLKGYGEIADHILSFMPEEPFDKAQV